MYMINITVEIMQHRSLTVSDDRLLDSHRALVGHAIGVSRSSTRALKLISIR